MDQMEQISAEVTDLQRWRGVADHRIGVVERQRAEDIKQVIRLEAEVNQVDRKVSRIEGGIEFLKWSIPVSITVATGIGAVIVWVLGR